MATPHIESKKEDIAKVVLTSGDPLRIKMIADNYLTDVIQVNGVRNMLGYTGNYKGKRITLFPVGMGIPSIGIYAYELYKVYDVETIIRIGTCGSNREDVKILDVLLADCSYSLSTFAELFTGDKSKMMYADKELNERIKMVAEKMEISLKTGTIITSDVFDVYLDDINRYESMYPTDLNSLGSEMEAFALFYLAKILNRKAACLLTVVDSRFDPRVVTSEERQNSLNTMIELALETCL